MTQPSSKRLLTEATGLARTTRPQHAPALGLWFPEAEGALGDSSHDDTSAVNAAVAAAQAGGGGTVLLDPSKTYKMLGAFAPVYGGSGTGTVQKPVRITSPGTVTSNGFWGASPLNGGATLDLRYDGTGGAHPAKIDTRGAGRLEIDHINLISGGTDDFPILQTTNTEIQVHHNYVQGNLAKTGSACVQDAFILGGTTNTVGNAADAPFQGYGSKIHDNYFAHIRRGFVGRTFCNSTLFENNTFSTTCGNDGTGTGNSGGGYELHGRTSSDLCVGNIERNNVIESVNYKYAVALENAIRNSIGPSGYWDASTIYEAAVYCGPAADYNTIFDGYHTDTFPLVAGPNKLNNTIRTSAQSRASFYPQPSLHRGPIMALNPFGQGFVSLTGSGDGGMLDVVAGIAGSPTYPQVGLRTQPAKSVADVATTNGSRIITSATAAWTRQHEYMPIKCAGNTQFPSGTVISRYISPTSVELSAACTATATGVTVQYGSVDGEMGSSLEVAWSRRHYVSQGAVGTASPNGNAGTGATASAVGTDTAFTLTLNTGTGAMAAGNQVAVAAGINWTAAAKVVITPKNAAAAAAVAANQIYCTNTGSNFFLAAGVALPNSTTLIFDVIQIQ